MSDAARDRMVASILRRNLTDPDVLRAMTEVPRHAFVPADLQAHAYADSPLPIGLEQTISQPYVVALMAALARVRPGSRVLDVGLGSGYQAAVLAAIGAEVYAIERLEPLMSTAVTTLKSLDYVVHARLGDGRAGWPEAAPFDAILVAAATPLVAPAWLEQLAPATDTRPGGRLVLPLGDPDQQELVLLERIVGGIRRTTHGAVAFVPLV